MEDDQAKADFRKASALYEMGRHQEAMQMLTNLDRAFPNNPDILYALARCMAKQGWNDDALEICGRLETRFRHSKGRRLKERILGDLEKARQKAVESPNPNNVVDLPGFKQLPDFSSQKWIYAASAVVLIAIAVLLYLIIGSMLSANSEPDNRPVMDSAPISERQDSEPEETEETEDRDTRRSPDTE